TGNQVCADREVECEPLGFPGREDRLRRIEAQLSLLYCGSAWPEYEGCKCVGRAGTGSRLNYRRPALRPISRHHGYGKKSVVVGRSRVFWLDSHRYLDRIPGNLNGRHRRLLERSDNGDAAPLAIDETGALAEVEIARVAALLVERVQHFMSHCAAGHHHRIRQNDSVAARGPVRDDWIAAVDVPESVSGFDPADRIKGSSQPRARLRHLPPRRVDRGRSEGLGVGWERRIDEPVARGDAEGTGDDRRDQQGAESATGGKVL